MKFTGERVVPNDMHGRPDVYSEHIIRYALALKYCAMNDVLDVACGTGYGTDLLGSVSKSITGGDNDPKSLEYAKNKYGLNLKHIDLNTQSIWQIFMKKFDVIVSFETIEHLSNPLFFMNSVKHALETTGLFIFSLPIKNSSEYHKFSYSYHQALGFGNNLFKPLRAFVQKNDLIISPKMALGDYNSKGTYIIKVMSLI